MPGLTACTGTPAPWRSLMKWTKLQGPAGSKLRARCSPGTPSTHPRTVTTRPPRLLRPALLLHAPPTAAPGPAASTVPVALPARPQRAATRASARGMAAAPREPRGRQPQRGLAGLTSWTAPGARRQCRRMGSEPPATLRRKLQPAEGPTNADRPADREARPGDSESTD